MELISGPVRWDGDLICENALQIWKRGLSGSDSFSGGKLPETTLWDDEVVIAGIWPLCSPCSKTGHETQSALQDIQVCRPEQFVDKL
jgi:hypothetical protein